MDAGKRTINDIFNGNRIIEIPFFQRAYVWGEEQWERLLSDMEDISATNKPYFLGSVILKQQPTRSGEEIGDLRTLIDGQQRLTTLNIFFKVLYLKNNSIPSFDRIFRLMNNELALWHNHNDINSFEKILNLMSLDEIEVKDNITRAYQYFKDKIKPEKINTNSILKNVLFVGIDLDSNEDEQQIFDTINSLGVNLTTAELLKNYFFKRDEKHIYEKYWKNIFEIDEETKDYWDKEFTSGRLKRTFIDIFFYSYLQIKIQDKGLNVKTEDKLMYSKVDNLFESYKDFITKYNQDKKVILNEIEEYAKIFRSNFNFNVINEELKAEYGIERINTIIFGLDTSTLISYVLYVLKHVKDESEKRELFEVIESYIMRRIVVHASTKNYNQLFTDRLINNEIISKNKFLEYIKKGEDKVNYFPNDEELKKGFITSELINKQSAGIIYFIESIIRNKNKHSTSLLGISKYSLEHLMPKKWENNWGKLKEKKDQDIRNRKLLTLGNLAIITQSLNSSIRDAEWGVKRKKLNEYSAGIETLSSYLDLEEWNEIEIEKRGNFLYEKALEIWKFY